LGLSRINETIQPAAERIQRVAQLGFLVASSDTEATVAEDQEVLLTIREGDQRDLFVPTPFLALVRRTSYADYAIASLISYSQETGQLLVRVRSVKGNPGPHNDWDVAALAGHVIAMDDALEATQVLRDAVAADLLTVAEDKATVAADKQAAQTAKQDAEAARTGAENALASFLRVYRGALAEEPPDGELGHFYFDTTLQQARVYTATGWAPLFTVTLGGIRQGQDTATEGQTEFDVGGGFTFLNVFKNGVLLQPGVDYTAASPKFTLAVGATAGDVIAYFAYYATEQTDFYTKESADDRFLRYDGVQGLTPTQQSQARANIGASVLAGFRNKIINGNFDIWQRGTNFATPSAWSYTADRWRVAYDGNIGSFSITRKDFALGQTDVPGNPAYYLRWNQVLAPTGTTFSLIATTIEDVLTFADETVTLTFYAAASKALAINVGITQQFGTGGSPSADVFTSLEEVALGTTWGKFAIPVKLPSISGKTIGTSGGDHIIVNFFLPVDTTFIFDLARVSLIAGDATAEADPFSPRLLQQEIALCQRYFCKSFSLNQTPASNTGSAGAAHWRAVKDGANFGGAHFSFPVLMRTTPTIRTFNPGAAGNQARTQGNRDCTSTSANAGPTSMLLFAQHPAETVANELVSVHWTAEAEL